MSYFGVIPDSFAAFRAKHWSTWLRTSSPGSAKAQGPVLLCPGVSKTMLERPRQLLLHSSCQGSQGNFSPLPTPEGKTKSQVIFNFENNAPSCQKVRQFYRLYNGGEKGETLGQLLGENRKTTYVYYVRFFFATFGLFQQNCLRVTQTQVD